jgi:hypothetical protein
LSAEKMVGEEPDVVIASSGQFGQPGVVSVMLGAGDGTLKAPGNTQVNQGAQSVARRR